MNIDMPSPFWHDWEWSFGCPLFSMILGGCTLFFISDMSSTLFLMLDGCLLMKRDGGSGDCIVCGWFGSATNSRCLCG
jgi:hypothetical protein